MPQPHIVSLDLLGRDQHCPAAPARVTLRPGAVFVGDGAIAQLGERLVRNEEVSGSIPLGSTTPDPLRMDDQPYSPAANRPPNWMKGVPAAAAARRRNADLAALRLLPAVLGLQAEGVQTLHALAAGLNALGVRTVRNTQWTPTAVRRLLDRAAQLGAAQLGAAQLGEG